MERLLLVEDNDSLREVLATVLEHSNFAVHASASAEEALSALGRQHFSCILADFKLPQMNGIELLKKVRTMSSNTPFVIMTAYGSVDIAVEAMKEGANDFLTKPFEPDRICDLMREVLTHRRIIDRSSNLERRRERSFLTKTPEIEELLAHARKVARVDSSVLILGESGTGKELIARYIHEQSPRKDQPFIAVNCAAMPASLLESEFFGHEAGAFTGATQTRIGVFELADTGTIFLDEVGDMPPALQVKLLRALQEREIKRVGGSKTIRVRPRVIAATNRNIDSNLSQGLTREDFYYRIAVVTLHIPPLRERRADIALLTDYFVNYFCTSMKRPLLKVDAQAAKMLQTYSWPGNARELENVIERAVVLADTSIRVEHLGISLTPTFDALADAVRTLPEIAALAARSAEVDLITRTLRDTQGNKTKAAEALGVSYKTLLNKVKEYGIEDEREGLRH